MFGILRLNNFKTNFHLNVLLRRGHAAGPQNTEKLENTLKQPPSESPRPPSNSDHSGGQKRSGGYGKKIFGLTLLLAGGITAATYVSPEFRKLLETNVPYSSETLGAFVDWSDKTFHEFYNSATAGQKAFKPEVKPIATLPGLAKSTPIEIGNKASGADAHLPSETDITTEVERQEEMKKKRLQDFKRKLKDSLKTSNYAFTTAKKDIAELVKKTQLHGEKLKEAIESDSVTDDEVEHNKKWSAAHDASVAKKDAKPIANTSHANATKLISELKELLREGFSDPELKSHSFLADAQRTVTQMQYELSDAMSEVSRAESEYKMIIQYKDLVEGSRNHFLKELQSLLPDVDMKNKTEKLTEEEMHSLLIHANRKIDRLHLQLAEQEALFKKRINSALQQQRSEDNNLAKEQVDRELERIANEAVLEKQRMEEEIRKDFDRELTQALARQAGAHNDHLRQVLRHQRESLEMALDLELRERLIHEREHFQVKIEKWLNRVLAIEAVVEGRAALEHEARSAQELWLATQSLCNGTMSASFTPLSSNKRLPPLNALAKIVTEMAERSHASFIQELLHHLPPKALTDGVYSDAQLLQRFKKVKKICRRVAMLDESGVTIPMYILSWLLSVFVFESISTLQAEDEVLLGDSLHGEPNKASSRIGLFGLNKQMQLDTFVLLSSAERALQEGQLELAVRFLGQLKGMPAAVVRDWLQEAWLLLETRQVARSIRAAASAQGMAGMVLPDPQ